MKADLADIGQPRRQMKANLADIGQPRRQMKADLADRRPTLQTDEGRPRRHHLLDGLRTPEEQVRRVPDPRVDVLLEVVELGLREPEGEK